MLIHAREFSKFAWKSLRRGPLLWQIRNLASWKPLLDAEEGYTIVIAAMSDLWPVAIANLRLIAKCDLDGLREVIVVIDQLESQIPDPLRRLILAVESAGLTVRLIAYTAEQHAVARRIHWGWVYSWLSWSIGIANARTRYVLLHDLDAMPIEQSVFATLSAAAQHNNSQFQGIRHYSGNGVKPEMGLATTFEMVLDVEWLRRNANPIECFNQICFVDGRYVDFDTLLYVQTRATLRRVEPISESYLVHPTQLICQYTDLVAGRQNRIGSANRIPVLCYFMNLGNPEFDLSLLGDQIADESRHCAEAFRSEMNIALVQPANWAWMEKQIRRLEQRLFGSTRAEVQNFLRGFALRAGDARTVGREAVEAGGVLDR